MKIALATYPDREETLIAAHVRSEQRHQQLVDNLEMYIVDGTKPDDLESLRAASLFSVRSKKSVAQSCPALHKRSAETASRVSQARSTTISETRVQAALAKRRFAQQQAEQEELQKKIDFERDVARQHRELDIRREEAEARERKLKEEAEARERQLQEESERRKRELDRRQRELQEEAELHKRELENALQLKKQRDEMENLEAELRLRHREEVRGELGSDYDSDSDRDDVTQPKQYVAKPQFQLESEQDEHMQNILRSSTVHQQRAIPDARTTRDSVNKWLQNPPTDSTLPSVRASHNNELGHGPPKPNYVDTATQPQRRPACDTRRDYVPSTTNFDDVHRSSGNFYDKRDADYLSGPRREPGTTEAHKPNHRQDNSDIAALFGRALLENRMPAPKQLEFDGNPKTFMAFLASFKTNIERKLSDDNEDDASLKLTYLLQHCTGRAKDLIDDCAMLDPVDGFETAMNRLHDSYGQGHVIARSYIESVTKGPVIKLNDVGALEQLRNDMVKCQSVLSRLEFTSDLDSTGTLESIIQRLPDSFQLKWARRAAKILKGGRDTLFVDLVEFIREESSVYNTKFGSAYAERKSATTKHSNDSSKKEKPKPKAKVTTLATSAGETTGSTAGPPSTASTAATSTSKKCEHCDGSGHLIGRCHKFKRLKRDEKLEVIKNKNLCFCCLKTGHGSKECEKRCVKCDKKHHVLIHEGNDYAGKASAEKSSKSTAATEAVTLSTSKVKSDATLGALPVRVKMNGKEKLVVALVDSGSNTTLVRRSVVDELGITGEEAAPVAVHTMNGPALQQDELVCKLELLSDDRSASVIVDEALTVPAIPVRAVVDGKAFNEWPHLSDLELPYIPRAKISIIIGTDCPEMHRSLEERHAGRKDPIARRTPLGWIVLGPSEKSESVQSLATTVGTDPLAEQLKQMSLLDFQDTIVSEPAMSVDDRRALKTMQETAKLVNGKYQVGIPWKVDPDEALQNNRSMAESRLRMLKRKFSANPQLADDYSKTVEAYISDGHAKLVEDCDSNDQGQWFLPHHAVFKRSNPSKCRVVFDCAAEYKGISLNDAVLQGTELLEQSGWCADQIQERACGSDWGHQADVPSVLRSA